MKLSDEDKARLAGIVVIAAEANEIEDVPNVKVTISQDVITLRCENEQRSFVLLELDKAEEYLNALVSEASRIGMARKSIRTGVNSLLQTLDQDSVNFEHLSDYMDVMDSICDKLFAYICPVKVDKDDEDDF